MSKELDWEFQNSYPRLYPLASAMGVTKLEIDSWMKRIWDSYELRLKYKQSEAEIIVRAILARLNYNHKLIDYISFNDFYLLKGLSDEKLEVIFGKNQIEIVKKLLQ